MDKVKLLTAREFSTLYDIPRYTLQYYSRIGLLKPFAENRSGYGLYSHEQGHILQLIRLLKLGGSSLKEINDMLYVEGASEFVDFMEAKRKKLEEEKSKIERALSILDHYDLFKRTTLNLASNKMRIVDNQENFYILVTEESKDKLTEDSFIDLLNRHIRRCESKPRDVMDFPIGKIYSLEKKDSQVLTKFKGFCNYAIGFPEDVQEYRRIEPGSFLTYKYSGRGLELDENMINSILNYIEDRNYMVSQDLYLIPFPDRLGEDKSDYYCRIFLGVERKDG